MALPGRGELRTRRGAGSLCALRGAGPRREQRDERDAAGPVPAPCPLPRAAEGPAGLWCSEEPALLPPGRAGEEELGFLRWMFLPQPRSPEEGDC